MTVWRGKNILVIGAARQGLAATRYFSKNGANVTLNDGREKTYFQDVIENLNNQAIKFHFGSHPSTLLVDKDMICVSGGVPLDIPLLKEAQKRNIPLTNDAQIFIEGTKAKVIGITGSAGKTTTTTFIGEIAKKAVQPHHKVWVGGNIGVPLIEHIEDISENDWVVMELSSFQLELMTTSPHIALILNITPNHLDRHGTMAAYISSKGNILKYQKAEDIAILNRDEENSISFKEKVKGKLLTFGWGETKSDYCGTFIKEGFIHYSLSNRPKRIMPIDKINLPGKHNQANTLAACAAGIAAGFPVESIRAGIESVHGIPHRLELVATKNNIRWYNDSIATAPERVIAALEAIHGPLVLLLGGRDKNLPWEKLAQIISSRHPKLILFGEAGNMIENTLRRDMFCGESFRIDRYKNLDDAVHRAAEIAEPGESVLLSPGGTSYDAFIDFEERGNIFKKLVEEIA